jgi:transmembrane 9 superfamily protein 2/4
VLNLFLVYSNSSSAIPFGTLLAVFVLWVVVSLPLSLLGAYFGFKRSKMQIPVRTHQIPRQIPIQSKVTSKLSFFILGGLLPFGAIFVELFFIMNSIWANRTYYVFGFLLIVFMVMLITCSLVAILMTYLLLCAENYHWWWRSFFSGFSVGFYLFVYSIGFYITRLEFRQFSSTVIYFGWSFAISFLVGLLAGTIGILASFLFIRKIYSIVKVGMRD